MKFYVCLIRQTHVIIISLNMESSTLRGIFYVSGSDAMVPGFRHKVVGLSS